MVDLDYSISSGPFLSFETVIDLDQDQDPSLTIKNKILNSIMDDKLLEVKPNLKKAISFTTMVICGQNE